MSGMTGRLPFDPRKMAQPEAAAPVPAPADRPLTVSQLASRISDVIGTGFTGKTRVIGEVSGFRDRTHWYFDLKDAGAVIGCVMFAAVARKAKFTPANGQEIIASGRVEYYEKQGRVTVLVERIDPVGAGAQDLALKALLEEIRGLGWLEEGRKRPLPAFPRRIGVVTSRTGAALQDVIETMRKRCPAVGITVVDARVQGDGAAAEVASAIRWFGASRDQYGIDAILVTRGGGSKEDLWAFNERIVAEAIVQSPIPVVAAIGHETDTTIAELVADLRCSTPTQAAVRLTPDRAALREQVDAWQSRLRTTLTRDLKDLNRHADTLTRSLRQAGTMRVRSSAHALDRLAGRLESHRPAAAQARRAAVLHTLTARLSAAMRSRLTAADVPELHRRLALAMATERNRASAQIESLHKRLTSVGPSSVLNRGFSYTTREDGTLVRSVSAVRAGDVLKTTVSDGDVRSVVTPEGATTPPAPTSPKRRKPPSPPPGDALDLFGQSR